MSRQIEQALLSLLPTQNSNLPPLLVETAGSLLARSRNHASTLKAEEEVARLYACCHLACDRLKITLNLPPIEPRPPIPPRIYKRLYTHLDRILPATSVSGRRKANGLGTPTSKGLGSPASRPLPSRGTPGKDLSLAAFRTPGKVGTSTKLNSRKTATRLGHSFPPWLRPTVRYLCNTLNTDGGSDLAPTIILGLESILAPHHQKSEDEWVNGHLTALVAATYCYAFASAQLAPGEDMTRNTFGASLKTTQKKMPGALKTARNEVKIPNAQGKKSAVAAEEEESIFWEGWQQSLKAADINEAINEFVDRGWLESDWFRSIDLLRVAEQGAEDVDPEARQSTAAAVQIRKADTMLQDKFDYLSERKRAGYRQWKAGILRRVEAMERAQSADAHGGKSTEGIDP